MAPQEDPEGVTDHGAHSAADEVNSSTGAVPHTKAGAAAAPTPSTAQRSLHLADRLTRSPWVGALQLRDMISRPPAGHLSVQGKQHSLGVYEDDLGPVYCADLGEDLLLLGRSEERVLKAMVSVNPAEVDALKADLKQKQELIASLRKQLQEAEQPKGNASKAISLEEARSRLSECAALLMQGDESAQADFEKWDTYILTHPEYAKEKEKEAQQWLHDNEKENRRALILMRTFVPPEIYCGSLKELKDSEGMTEALAKRVWKTKALWLLRADTDFISRIHESDLRIRYTFNGLDLVELRALFACVPDKFENDSNGLKQEWRVALLNKVKDLARRAEANDIPPGQRRHPAYSGLSRGPFDPSPAAQGMRTNKSTAYENTTKAEIAELFGPLRPIIAPPSPAGPASSGSPTPLPAAAAPAAAQDDRQPFSPPSPAIKQPSRPRQQPSQPHQQHHQQPSQPYQQPPQHHQQPPQRPQQPLQPHQHQSQTHQQQSQTHQQQLPRVQHPAATAISRRAEMTTTTASKPAGAGVGFPRSNSSASVSSSEDDVRPPSRPAHDVRERRPSFLEQMHGQSAVVQKGFKIFKKPAAGSFNMGMDESSDDDDDAMDYDWDEGRRKRATQTFGSVLLKLKAATGRPNRKRS